MGNTSKRFNILTNKQTLQHPPNRQTLSTNSPTSKRSLSNLYNHNANMNGPKYGGAASWSCTGHPPVSAFQAPYNPMSAGRTQNHAGKHTTGSDSNYKGN